MGVKTRVAVVCLVLALLALVAVLGLRRGAQSPRKPSAGEIGRRGEILDREGVVLALDSARPEAKAQNNEPDQRFERIYPLGETAANLVGFVSRQEAAGRRPVSGLELGIDSVLKHGDARLTIDADLQRNAFQMLQHSVRSTRAAQGSALVMTIATGEILALADYPGYDPTRARMYPSEAWRCHAVTDEFAPGPLAGDWELMADNGKPVAEELGLGHSAGIGLPAGAAGALACSLPAFRASLLQLVQGYATIANRGRMNHARLVAPQASNRKPPAANRNQVLGPTLAAQLPNELTRSEAGGLEFAGAGGAIGQDSLSPILVYVGIFPAGEPKYVAGVMLDRPLTGYFNSETARLLCEDIGRRVGEQ